MRPIRHVKPRHATSAHRTYIRTRTATPATVLSFLTFINGTQTSPPSSNMAPKTARPGEQLAKLRAKNKATKKKVQAKQARAGAGQKPTTFLPPNEWLFGKKQPGTMTVAQARVLSKYAQPPAAPPANNNTKTEQDLIRRLAVAKRDNQALKKENASLKRKERECNYYKDRWSCLCGEFHGHVAWDLLHTKKLRQWQLLNAVKAAFQRGQMHQGSKYFSLRGMHPYKDYPDGKVI